MSTNVRATNWPTRSDAAANMPAKSRKGEQKASRRTYDARMLKATENKIEALLQRAERFAARVRCNEALAAVDAERSKLPTSGRATADTFKHENTDRYWGNPVKIAR